MGSILDNKGSYSGGNYEWGMGGTGGADKNANDRKEIDCSHLVNNLVKDYGYNIPYQTTIQLHNSKYYQNVSAVDVKPGDIILWNRHVGVVESYDPAKGTGTFFGSQRSTGPATAKFGGSKDYWKSPDAFLRPKDEYRGGGGNGDGNNRRGTEWGNGAGFIDSLLRLAEKIRDFFDRAQRFAPRADPLVLDLDGNGLETVGLNLASPVYFDHNADGIKTGTGWVKSDDAFLVLDRNGNGIIDDGRELFGDATPLNGKGTLDPSAGIAAQGFAALAKEDTNLDGVVNAADARFGALRLWRDFNQDGASQAGELFTLGSQNITGIHVASTEVNQLLPDGNLLNQTSSCLLRFSCFFEMRSIKCSSWSPMSY